MKYAVAGLLVAATCVAWAGSARAAECTLTISNGKVTLVADNTTARQILTEWARVGHTKVVNIEKLSGPPLTLRLENVPEQQALDIILRASSGFMVAERVTYDPAVSRFDRILVMPPSTLSASAATSRPGAPPAPAAAPPQPPPMPPPMAQPVAQTDDPSDSGADDPPPITSPYGDARPAETNFDYANPQEFLRRRQEMMQQQQQQQGNAPAPALFPGSVTPYTQPGPQQQTAPATTPGMAPGAPAGAARPGEIVKPPQQNQPAFMNPYGMPMAPGSTVEPDRAKYANPYQPTPPKQ